jgi:FkbM family methyltransferase
MAARAAGSAALAGEPRPVPVELPALEELSWTNRDELAFLQAKDEYARLLRLFTPSGPGGPGERRAVVVDVGGNNGMFALEAAKANPAFTSIFSFEPFERPFRCLESNASLMNARLAAARGAGASQITAVKAAVGLTGGRVTGTYLENYSLLSGFHVSQEDRAELERLAGRDLSHEFRGAAEEVASMRLDQWMRDADVPQIDLLKVDVEKAELAVLESLGERLKDSVRFLIAEVHEETKDAVLRLLRDAGFAEINVSEPAPPTFCLFQTDRRADNPAPRPSKPEGYDRQLNTYLVWAAKLPTRL